MANIEIISVRFNLAKGDDRRLFEALQKRSDPGKRNEFIKQVLLECLTDSGRAKPVMRTPKKQSRGPAPAEPVTGEHAMVIEETPQAAEPVAAPVPGEPSLHPAADKDTSAAVPDLEASGLVGSFVQ